MSAEKDQIDFISDAARQSPVFWAVCVTYGPAAGEKDEGMGVEIAFRAGRAIIRVDREYPTRLGIGAVIEPFDPVQAIERLIPRGIHAIQSSAAIGRNLPRLDHES